MGIERKFSRLITENEIFENEVKSIWTKENNFGAPFMNNLYVEMEELLKEYSSDKLDKFISQNEVFKHGWEKASKTQKKDLLNTIDVLYAKEAEFEEHLKVTVSPPVFVFIFTEDAHAVYVNGMKYYQMSEDERRFAKRAFECISRHQTVYIENNQKMEDYYQKHQEFPKWLKDLDFLNEAELSPKNKFKY